jgi:hypothetical protein
VLDKVTIAYRGATYEIGRGRDYFGIWTVEGPRSQPLEWWPETQEGWSAAWTRFAVLEAPDAIAPAGRNVTGPSGHTGTGLSGRTGTGFAPVIGAGRRGLVAALLLGVGVVLGIAGLFPDYLGGSSLASQPDNLIAHAIYLAVWTASAVLIVLGGTRLRVGALLATGLSIVTFGLFLADAGTPIAGGAHLAGAGLWLSFLGWLVCAAGSAMAFLIRPDRPVPAAPPLDPIPATDLVDPTDLADPVPATDLADPTAQADTVGARGRLASARGRLFTLGRPRGAALGPALLLVLAGLGAAAAFAPAWDSFTLRTAAGQTQTITAGNAFADPGPVIVGNVIVMIALAAVVIVAALWRPVRYGAALLAGAIIPMVAQAISALVQAGQTASPTQFGITPAQASQLGLTISSGLTPAFWIYCVFLVVLVVSCTWMLFSPHEEDVLVSAEPGDDVNTQAPTWHVARADAYDTIAVPTRAVDEDDWDIDEDSESDEFDSYEEFESDNPADSTVSAESHEEKPGRQD